MQKKIIALAVAALASSAAFAQSNVTVYGVADAFVGSYSGNQITRSTQVNSGGLAASRIGFKGTEDLGNGLKALFALEYRLDIDGNNSIGGTNATNSASTVTAGPARQQLVGLTGNFGTAVAGRLQTTGYDWAVSYDVLAGTAISPLQAKNAAQANANGASFLIGGTTIAARANNAIAYISPSFSGLTVAYNRAYLAEETGVKGNTAANTANNNVVADLLSLNYANGPLAAGLVYAKANAQGNAAIAGAGSLDADRIDWGFGASYNFGAAKAFATYQTTKLSNLSAADVAANPNATKTDKAWSVGVAVPVTAAGTVIASYAKRNSASAIDATAAQIAAGQSSFQSTGSAYTVAYTHALSKRTTAYTGYAHQVNNADIAAAGTVQAFNDTTTSQLVAGVNHKF